MPYIVWILTAAQALSMSVAPLVVFSGGLVGSLLSPSPELATLPLAIMVLGTAVVVLPVTQLMQHWGRKRVFLLGTVIASIGAALAGWSISIQSFSLYCFATFTMGASLAIAQQYRFAAMEAVNSDRAGTAASRVLIGGLIAAFLGPELVVYGKSLTFISFSHAESEALDQQIPLFSNAYVLLSALCLLAFLVIALGYKNTQSSQANVKGVSRSFKEVFSHPLIWLAIGSGAIGYAMMSFMMTATPLNMHQVVGHTLSDTKWVIQSHIMAMFLPSLFSGWLISKLGHKRLIIMGTLAYGICVMIALMGHHVMHYWWALVLLGIGWNFLFVGGTALLPFCYRSEERFKVQSINEFTIFSLQALAALSAGWVVNLFGWQTLLYSCVVLIGGLLGLLWLSKEQQIDLVVDNTP